jgi:hypothetical protein
MIPIFLNTKMPSFESVGFSLGVKALVIVVTRGPTDYRDKNNDDEDGIQTGNNSFSNTLCCTSINVCGVGEQSSR